MLSIIPGPSGEVSKGQVVQLLGEQELASLSPAISVTSAPISGEHQRHSPRHSVFMDNLQGESTTNLVGIRNNHRGDLPRPMFAQGEQSEAARPTRAKDSKASSVMPTL